MGKNRQSWLRPLQASRWQVILLAVQALIIASAPTRAQQVIPPMTASILFGTDRAHIHGAAPETFGTKRASALSLGQAQISLEGPDRRDLRSPVIAKTTLTPDLFFQALGRSIGANQRKKNALVIIHGHNSSFDQALIQAARLARSIRFDGTILVYSWASAGTLLDYVYDRESSRWAAPYLSEFLRIVAGAADPDNVSAIAFGLGNIALLDALYILGPTLPVGQHLNQIIMTVPDIDRDTFISLAARVKPYSRRMTLYVSASDEAMQLARRTHGGRPRAGDVPPAGPLVVAGIDTIQLDSRVRLSFNHSEFQAPPSVFNDVKLLLEGVGPPGSRLPELRRISTPHGDYWRFPDADGPAAEGHYGAMPVFFGTDRKLVQSGQRTTFGPDRGPDLLFGRAVVTIPKRHQISSGPERPSWWDIFRGRNPFREDPNWHFTVFEISLQKRDQFFETARRRLQEANVFKRHAFVFVHGYNVTFENALFRTAQIAYDLGFDGVPFLYSWPSGGKLETYLYDRDSAELTTDNLVAFLNAVIAESGADNVHLIAHSLGNDPLLRALARMAAKPGSFPSVSQIIFAAPDVDRARFEKMTAQIMGIGRNRTLYVSKNDAALIAARKASRDLPRAGDVPVVGPVVMARLDTIDASSIKTGVLSANHSGYAESRELLNDIRIMLQKGIPPKDRTSILEVIPWGSLFYWRFPQ